MVSHNLLNCAKLMHLMISFWVLQRKESHTGLKQYWAKELMTIFIWQELVNFFLKGWGYNIQLSQQQTKITKVKGNLPTLQKNKHFCVYTHRLHICISVNTVPPERTGCMCHHENWHLDCANALPLEPTLGVGQNFTLDRIDSGRVIYMSAQPPGCINWTHHHVFAIRCPAGELVVTIKV